jgi:putative hydrolase of the HAD superfamily
VNRAVTSTQITTLFLDIGGVLLTNGWDRRVRKRAASTFRLDDEEMEERHHLTFDTYEEGKLTLDEYLARVVFYERRDFQRDEFKKFMFAQSQPLPLMMELIKELKKEYGLKTVAVSNEGRELNAHRVDTFKLRDCIDFFIVSSLVHFRKPDTDMYRIALDTAQVQPSEVLYIEDRPMFIETAESLGIRGIRHSNYKTTKSILEKSGFVLTHDKEE